MRREGFSFMGGIRSGDCRISVLGCRMRGETSCTSVSRGRLREFGGGGQARMAALLFSYDVGSLELRHLLAFCVEGAGHGGHMAAFRLHDSRGTHWQLWIS